MERTRAAVPDKLYYKAAEVCQITDTQPYVLRFWESEFPQLSSEKNRNGQRVYRREDIDLIFRIKKLLYEEEFTIASARKAIEGNDTTIVDEPSARTAPRRGAESAAADRDDMWLNDRADEPARPPVAARASLFEGRDRSAETSENAVLEVQSERAAHAEALRTIDELRRDLSDAVAQRDALRDRGHRLADRLQAVLESSPSL
jgi:DNA-binding transcriptional MerR regulator